jgi:hypothetical protein
MFTLRLRYLGADLTVLQKSRRSSSYAFFFQLTCGITLLVQIGLLESFRPSKS